MKLFNEDFFQELNKKKNITVLFFIALCILFIAIYILSFFTNLLYVSIIAGIISVVVLVLFYYGLIFDKIKLIKLYKNINQGISQENTYTFKHYDGPTEHDGVKLTQLTCCFDEEGETFDRTLYFVEALPCPTLKDGQIITVKTYQNIITDIED